MGPPRDKQARLGEFGALRCTSSVKSHLVDHLLALKGPQALELGRDDRDGHVGPVRVAVGWHHC